MSLGSLLSIAQSALAAQQRAMEVTGHNVANANTPGYSRQTLQIQAATPLQMPMFSMGRGVEATTITRSRDAFYDQSYRTDNGQLGLSTTTNGYLSQIQSALNEPSTTGLSSALDGMFSAFSDLSSDPANSTNRQAVVAAASRVVSQLHSLSTQLTSTMRDAQSNLSVQVGTVNGLVSKIADLNDQIVASNGPGGPSSDLMDQRDNLIDQLSNYMDVRTTTNSDGSVSVLAGDVTLVSGPASTSLAMVAVGSGYGIAPAGGGPVLDAGSGSIKSLASLTQDKLPSLQAGLDQIASSLVTQFNTLHESGYTLTGATGVDFFDPTRTNASNIDLSAAVKSSTDNIAASATGDAGNGGIASQLAGFATTGVAALGGNTFREQFVSLASGVGIDVNNSQNDMDSQQTLVARDDQARTSVSGVSVDEEMVNLISQQQAYQAAARIVTVADQMVQSLLTLTTTA